MDRVESVGVGRGRGRIGFSGPEVQSTPVRFGARARINNEAVGGYIFFIIGMTV